MGYYTSDELNYYYFMATQFAMSDRFFWPVPTNSPDNRLYGLAATSQGYVHSPGQLTAKTIFEELEDAGISWKVYYSDKDGSGNPATHMNNFWGFTKNHLDKIVPISQYFTDLNNDTLPQVAFIEAGTLSGRDEHPGTSRSIINHFRHADTSGCGICRQHHERIDAEQFMEKFRIHSRVGRRWRILRTFRRC